MDLLTIALIRSGRNSSGQAADADDALEALAECGIVTPAYQDGVFYTDADGTIYVL